MSLHAAYLSSLEVVAANCEDVVLPVYDELFKRLPQFEELFVLDDDHRARGHMLNEALSMAEGLLQDDPVAHNFIAAERMNHAGYDISDDVFDTFYLVLADVFHKIAGSDWTAEMSKAWTEISRRGQAAKL